MCLRATSGVSGLWMSWTTHSSQALPDNNIRVWDLQSGRCIHTFGGHTATVRCIKITRPERTAAGTDEAAPEQPLVVSGSRDCTLRVWRLPSREDSEVVSTEGDEALEVSAILCFPQLMSQDERVCRLSITHITDFFSRDIHPRSAPSLYMVA